MPRGVYERTPEYRAKMAATKLGNTGRLGQPLSDEHRAKISASVSVALRGTRHGKPSAGSYIDAHGYRILTGQYDHPLAIDGELREHRKILYGEIGPGTHACHWCGKPLTWGGLTGICPDHLDDNKLNNSIENLVVSCNPCNGHRSKTSRTQCIRGHDYDEKNTYITPGGTRQCRACNRITKQARRVAP